MKTFIFMKKLIILLAAAAVAVGCSKKAESLEPDPPTPPVPSGLSISFERTDNIAVWPGRSIDVAYTLTGAYDDTRFEWFTENGWAAEIYKTSVTSGFLRATAPNAAADGDIIVKVSNDESHFAQQTLHFAGGFFNVKKDFYSLKAAEQELEIAVTTNIPYEVVIPDDAAWIEWINDPTAAETGPARFSIARNSGLALRQAEIEFTVDDYVIQTLTIAQYAAPSDKADIIRFADKNVKARLVKYYDLNKDGALSYQEAAAVTEWKCGFVGDFTITSFNEFQYFTGLTELSDAGWFYSCTALKSVILPENLTRLGSSVFSDCKSLKKIILPGGLKIIGEWTFGRCGSLPNIVLPDGLETIGNSAFAGCESLLSIDLPDGLETIGKSAFSGCTSLSNIDFPANLKTTGEQTFERCESLMNIVLPDGLETIGNRAFKYCKSLTNIVFPNSLKSIGYEAFSECESLSNIVLPEGVVKVGARAFSGCNLSEITFPSRVEEIDAEMVSPSVSSITFLSPIPPHCNGYDLLPDNSVAKIYVPAASLEAYKTAYGFSLYADRIFPIEE